MPFVKLDDAAEPCNKLDKLYHETKRAIELTKKFIADRGLICYGGTALDYASRLAGSKIYDDSKLDLPDLDFYSSDPVKDARDLADILFQNGFQQARQIKAFHVGTMRVDCGENHFVADVSYCPILSEIKTLTYESFLIVDPIYQRIDMHSSLSFPYDNAPREVIFDRWKKDTERFNIINALYPIVPENKSPHIKEKTSSKTTTEIQPTEGPYVYAGQIAYNSLASETPTKDVDVIELCSMDPHDTAQLAGLDVISVYEQYFNLLPEMYFCTNPGNGKKYIIYSTEDKLLSYESREIANKKYRVVCGNYVLKIFLGWLLVTQTNRVSWPWKPDYCADTKDIRSMYTDLLSKVRLSIKVYGTDNIGHTTLIQLEELENRVTNNAKYITEFPLPDSYKASTKNRVGEPFEYRSNPLLCISGIIKP